MVANGTRADAFAQPFGPELRAEWLTAAWGVTRSMSRTGNPYDNALAESFVATLKTECLQNQIPPPSAALRAPAPAPPPASRGGLEQMLGLREAAEADFGDAHFRLQASATFVPVRVLPYQ